MSLSALVSNQHHLVGDDGEEEVSKRCKRMQPECQLYLDCPKYQTIAFSKNVDDKIFNSNLLLHEFIYEQNVQSTGGQSRVKMQVYEEKKCAPTRKNVRTGAAAPSSVSLQISH